MDELTQKEWHCLNEYVKDLLGEMKENGDLEICDGCAKYTLQELETLQQKLLKIIEFYFCL